MNPRSTPARPVQRALIAALLAGAAACQGGEGDSLPSPGGGGTSDSGDDTGAGPVSCPAPPEPDLADTKVRLKDDADPDRDAPDYAWWWYDAAGRLVATQTRDGDDDDKTLSCVRTWGEGEELQAEQCWGMATYTYTWTWEDGLATGMVYDKDSDGSPERAWSYTWSAAGELEAEAWDTDLDGVFDEGGVSYTWEEGLLVEERWDYQGEGEADLVVSYGHDDLGHVVLEEVDDGADGSLEERTTRSFDAGGNPRWEEIDAGADGSAEQTTTWSYDEDCWNHRVDIQEAGSPDVRLVRAWDPDGFQTKETEFHGDNEDFAAQRRWSRQTPWDSDPPELP